MAGFKFYIIHNGKRVYFSYDRQTGFKEAKAYCAKHKLGKKKFFIVKGA